MGHCQVEHRVNSGGPCPVGSLGRYHICVQAWESETLEHTLSQDLVLQEGSLSVHLSVICLPTPSLLPKVAVLAGLGHYVSSV